MAHSTVPAAPVVPAIPATLRPLTRFGHLVAFLGHALAGVPLATQRYRRELLRLLSDVTWGNGSIVVGGGTAGVVLVLGLTTGALIAIEGYDFLDLLGLGPATGVISSLVTTRELAPIMAGLAFTVQAGCRFTTQIGSMRISEEIDALDSLAIRPIPYLVSTRVLASVVATAPLYLACLCICYLSCQVMVGVLSGGSPGPYLHYFTLLINGTDIVYSLVKAMVFVVIAATVQCYYGYCADGGPEGVGIAAGHAMRASIIMIVVVNMLLTMALWPMNSGARFGG